MTDTASPKSDLIEDLANIEHQRWSDWQAYLHGLCESGKIPSGGTATFDIGGALLIPEEKVKHWENLMHTQYYALPEHSKQADRDQVARYWPLIVEFVAMWLDDEMKTPPFPAYDLADKWREDMS